MQNAPHVDVVAVGDIEDQVREAIKSPTAQLRNAQIKSKAQRPGEPMVAQMGKGRFKQVHKPRTGAWRSLGPVLVQS